VSKLIAQLAMHNQKTVNKIYDPAAGSGLLLATNPPSAFLLISLSVFAT
jgi:type I restriction-modification system DNA methylase subunit